MKKITTILLFIISISVNAQDFLPPQIVNITIDPPIVDVLAGSDTVVITITASDSLSGLSNVAVNVVSPTGIQDESGSGTFGAEAVNGSAECSIEIKEFSESGEWMIESIYIFDGAGNFANLGLFELAQLDVPLTFEVVSNQDILPPILTTFILPPAIDVTFGPDSLMFTLGATDDISGLKSAVFGLKSPLGFHETAAEVIFDWGSSAETVTGYVYFNQFIEDGAWRLDYIAITDVIGNEFRAQGIILQALGVPTNVQVVSVRDIAPPVLTALIIDPLVVDASTGMQSVSVSVGATDNISGLSQATIVFESPSGMFFATAYAFFDQGVPAQVVTTELLVSSFMETGEWEISKIYLRDVAGNDVDLGLIQILGLGVPVTIDVIDFMPPIPTDVNEEEIPNEFALLQNYPNPFNPSTTIEYNVPETVEIEISLYDLLGKKMRVLYTGIKNAGRHRLNIEAGDLASGIYFYELKSDNFRDIKKCVLLR